MIFNQLGLPTTYYVVFLFLLSSYLRWNMMDDSTQWPFRCLIEQHSYVQYRCPFSQEGTGTSLLNSLSDGNMCLGAYLYLFPLYISLSISLLFSPCFFLVFLLLFSLLSSVLCPTPFCVQCPVCPNAQCLQCPNVPGKSQQIRPCFCPRTFQIFFYCVLFHPSYFHHLYPFL